MPLRFTSRILEHLAHARYRPSTPDHLARDLQVAPADMDVFREAVKRLADEKLIEVGRDGLVRLPAYGEELIGRLRLNPRGYGFVVPETPHRDGDLFIPPGRTRDAISGDQVRARVIRQGWRSKAPSGRSPFVGEVVEVLERGRENFVGVVFERGGSWFVQPQGPALGQPVLIRDPRVKGAKAGDQVVIELVHYPEPDYVPEGVIVRVLGEAGRPDVETEAVIVAHGLRTGFPPSALAEASAAVRSFEAGPQVSGREDLTGHFAFTIDPPDARDFDDAISISQDAASGEWTLGVHIADVSHFVRPSGRLDEEARLRGNSVYLPRLVIPMLPEVISNGVCSLQEGVERLTQSVFITLGPRGKVLRTRLASTVIRSRKRLTYLEAQALIDGDVAEARRHAATASEHTEELIETLRLCDRLARVLRSRRLADGMIVLALPEVELVFDQEGHVTDAHPEDDAFTHTIIEMFMVEANEAVARTFDGLEVPVLRRIHPDPVPGDIEELQMYARGMHVSLPERPTRRDLQRLLDATRGTPAARAIHFAVLRTLARASYSPALIGHFALASDHYAHFTSPIRRYPDLAVHRALQVYVEATDNGRKVPEARRKRALGRRVASDPRVPDEAQLVELGRHCSETETEAEAAENELREFLVLQFLAEHHLGAEFDGVVSGVGGGGLYVSIDKFLVEGLVRAEEIPRHGGAARGGSGDRRRTGRWQADEGRGRLVDRATGASIGVGDIVTVQIARVDLPARHLDLRLTSFPERAEAAAADGEARGPRRRAAPETPRGKGKRKGYKQGRRGRRSR